MNKLASSVSATEALAKEHREHRNEPLITMSAAFLYPKILTAALPWAAVIFIYKQI